MMGWYHGITNWGGVVICSVVVVGLIASPYLLAKFERMMDLAMAPKAKRKKTQQHAYAKAS